MPALIEDGFISGAGFSLDVFTRSFGCAGGQELKP